jgi:hypothetical protein
MKNVLFLCLLTPFFLTHAVSFSLFGGGRGGLPEPPRSL